MLFKVLNLGDLSQQPQKTNPASYFQPLPHQTHFSQLSSESPHPVIGTVFPSEAPLLTGLPRPSILPTGENPQVTLKEAEVFPNCHFAFMDRHSSFVSLRNKRF